LILTDPRRPITPSPGPGARTTLDDLLRRPNSIALLDPPNRESFTDGRPRRLTYAQADRMVSAIAGRLRRIGLTSDAIVGLQMANTVDSVLTLLGVLRAGLIAMPLPLLWRRADAVTALSRVGANALIVTGRVGNTNHFDLAMGIAAEIFPIRYVCGFGKDAPDGLVPFDNLHTVERLDPLPAIERERAKPPGPGAHLAVITWDVSAEGLYPVARSHAELVAGGLAALLEGRIGQDAVLVSTLALSSFAALSVAVVPWLLVGGSLALHQPFDPATFLTQQKGLRPDAVVVPGPLVAQLTEAGHLSAHDGLKCVYGVWRTPERLARARAWREPRTAMVDVQVFGETGLIAARRSASGRPAAIPFGPITAPRGGAGAMVAGEIAVTPKGTVAMRGAMVPRITFPVGAERTQLPHLKVQANGFVDTGYSCRNEGENTVMLLTGPPPGVVGIGGYRFVLNEMQEIVKEAENGSTLAALPDPLAGHRLEGTTNSRETIEGALTDLGVNPLVAAAFRERRRPAA
jgi:hypothetical protein